MDDNKTSKIAKKEEEILAFWKEKRIFEKSLEKKAPYGEYIFYDGPATVNASPGIHHLESRSFKDIIPRYKTMRGYHVRRKVGWDTHGLPVEIQVEKELGFKSKKEIEEYGIEKFNDKCKELVQKHISEWEKSTERIAYWIDQKNPYITYTSNYIESLWYIFSKIYDKGLLYKDYKVVPWCPRCETVLSSHELAQGYEDIKDLSVYAKFKIKGEDNTYFVAWTTTPWTLPGNVALAIGEKIKYVKIKAGEEFLIFAKDRLSILDCDYTIIDEKNGNELVGMSYEPLYPFISTKKDIENIENGWKVYSADFVTTKEGTGIVHTAVMYGQDDFELGNRVGLPKYHLVCEDGHFFESTGILSGRFVRDEETTVSIIKDLARRNLLLKKEKYEHSYPHCWRCRTPLIYYARDSWYIRVSLLKDKLISENEDIKWEPAYIKNGRFGEWLKDIRDWAISRERYWGTPIPIWRTKEGVETKVIGSISDLKKETKRNTYYVIRHGEAESNTQNIVSALKDNPHHLTEKGEKQVLEVSKKLKSKKIDYIIASPFIRTKESVEIISKECSIPTDRIIFDERIKEIDTGDFNLKPVDEYREFFSSIYEKFTKKIPNGETASDVKKRVGDFLYDIDTKYKDKNILIVTHEYVVWMLDSIKEGLTDYESALIKDENNDYIGNAELRNFNFAYIPHNKKYELDMHRPYIDEIVLISKGGEKMYRVLEVADVWFDSGCMPFAQDHFPFEDSNKFQPKKGWFKKQYGYPADYISEAIDQTRGWFYTLHVIGVLLGYGKAYKNVICLGHILDEKGKKMSKSLGNIVKPEEMIEKYGVDSLRFWMYSVNQPGDSKSFDERSVDEIVKKILNPLINTVRFYEMYKDKDQKGDTKSENKLDKWIVSRLSILINDTKNHLDYFEIFKPARDIKEFIGDLSTWYVRRSRERFKNDLEKNDALRTLSYVLNTLSKVMAPFTPFIAEEIYQSAKKNKDPESVHLCDWPESKKIDKELIFEMEKARSIVTLLLEKREKAKIKVRQPLPSATIKEEITIDILNLIKDEVNVKEISVDKTLEDRVDMDTTISKQLKEEGYIRELIRNIQSLRKKNGLTTGKVVGLLISTNKEGQNLISHFEDVITKSTNTNITFVEEVDMNKIVDGDFSYKLKIKN